MSQPELPPLTEADRNAMRAFLQRSEVRLSTMHRIALAFIGGAGLLLLIPVFFKDVIDNILLIMLAQLNNQFETMGTSGIIVTGILYITLAYPVLLSLSIPLYGVYLVLKDVVHFYFTIYMPGFSNNLLNPTFSLTGLTFWNDESPEVKKRIMQYQYQPHQMDFMIPFSQGQRESYFDTIIKNTHEAIIPPTRHIEDLRERGVLSPDIDEKDVRHFNATLGIVRSLDRTLVEDVALTEMTLARNVLYLRRLMLRYIKTLLIFIWTTVISFMMLPFLQDGRFSPLLVLSISYFIWAVAVMPIIRLPIGWIYRHRYEDIKDEHIDTQLTLLDERVRKYNYAGFLSATIALILSLLATII